MQFGLTGRISCCNWAQWYDRERARKTPNTIFASVGLFDLCYTGVQRTSSEVKISENSYPHCFSVGEAHLAMRLPWPFPSCQTPVTLLCARSLSRRTMPTDSSWGKFPETLLVLDHILNPTLLTCFKLLSVSVGLAIVTPLREEEAKINDCPQEGKTDNAVLLKLIDVADRLLSSSS